jgi:hypothetical protein
MRVKEYRVLEECIERGIEFGWRRAHKHTDTPDPATIQCDIHHAVMNEMSDFFDFADDEEEQ